MFCKVFILKYLVFAVFITEILGPQVYGQPSEVSAENNQSKADSLSIQIKRINKQLALNVHNVDSLSQVLLRNRIAEDFFSSQISAISIIFAVCLTVLTIVASGVQAWAVHREKLRFDQIRRNLEDLITEKISEKTKEINKLKIEVMRAIYLSVDIPASKFVQALRVAKFLNDQDEKDQAIQWLRLMAMLHLGQAGSGNIDDLRQIEDEAVTLLHILQNAEDALIREFANRLRENLRTFTSVQN